MSLSRSLIASTALSLGFTGWSMGQVNQVSSDVTQICSSRMIIDRSLPPDISAQIRCVFEWGHLTGSIVPTGHPQILKVHQDGNIGYYRLPLLRPGIDGIPSWAMKFLGNTYSEALKVVGTR